METGLSGRTVLVTGASGGIGCEIARSFANENANVVIHYHQNQAGAELVAREVGVDRALAVQADLTQEKSVDQLFGQAAKHFGSIDHLICNAGVWPPHSVPLSDMTVDQWQQTLDIDLTSVFLCCRSFLQNVKSSSIVDPSIVLIGSTAGVFGEAGHGDYASAKSALIGGMMLTLKNEVVEIAPKGRVNSVSPGWVITPMTEKFGDDPQAMSRALSTIAMRKVASPQDIANAVVFLSSPQVAGHITGQNLVVSGGMEGRMLNETKTSS